MEYRDIKYEYKTWLTYTGEFADCFSCSDTKLFKDVSDYAEMCTSTLEDMHSKINYYLDNKDKLSRYKKVKKTIVSTFYETLNYKGD